MDKSERTGYTMSDVVTLEVILIDEQAVWMSDISDSSSDTMDTAMVGLWCNAADDSIWGAIHSVLGLYASLGFEPHKTAIGRKPTWNPFDDNLSLGDNVYDLVAECDLPDDPSCTGADKPVCVCHGCQLYERIVDTILDYGLRSGWH